MPRRVRLVLVATLGASLLLGGCSSGSSKPSAADPPAASTTAGSVPSVEKPPPAPEPARGKDGERAFARHVIDLWAYALRTNDAGPLAALGAGTRPCGGCDALRRELAKRRAQGWTVDFPGIQVRRVRLARQGAVQIVSSAVDIPATDSYNADGSYRNSNPAHDGATFVVRMRFIQKRYRLVSFTVS